MNKKALFLVFSACLLAGCATPQRSWYKSGASRDQFEMDRGQCDAQAFSVPGMQSLQVAMVYNGCMRGKGWTLR